MEKRARVNKKRGIGSKNSRGLFQHHYTNSFHYQRQKRRHYRGSRERMARKLLGCLEIKDQGKRGNPGWGKNHSCVRGFATLLKKINLTQKRSPRGSPENVI